MTNLAPHRGWRSRIRLRAASVAVALVVVLVQIFVATPSGEAQADTTFTLLYSFQGGSDGAGPDAGLVVDEAGNIYGTTVVGGAPHAGTVFKLDTTGAETVLHTFTGPPDGQWPEAVLVRDAAGNLYGTTYTGGVAGCNPPYGCGTVFKLDTTGAETVLHSFTGGATDGANPTAGLVLDAAGNLYGATWFGGDALNCGTVFKLDTTGAETVLYSFTGSPLDGQSPSAGLVMDAAGNLYGTTFYGGPSGWGTVFKLDTTGKETVLYRFKGDTDGFGPYAGLVRDVSGNLYGTTTKGGSHNCDVGCGTVFKLDPTGTKTVLHTFTRARDGASPLGGLVRDAAGNLYGTTNVGGAFGRGTVFKLDATGKLTILHSFTGAATDGAAPRSGLVRDAAGNLYGTTLKGGAFSKGTVFKISP